MTDAAAIDAISRALTRVREHAAETVQLPDADVQLRRARAGEDIGRRIRHIHQMCYVHSSHFRQATWVKLAYSLDGFLAMAERRNGVGLYLFARSVLELYATVLHLCLRLSAAAADTTDPARSGEVFFSEVLKARSGTSDPRVTARLRRGRVPAEALARHVVSSLLKEAVDHGAPSWLREHYAVLCDYVHHQVSSRKVATVEPGQIGRAPGGQRMFNTSATGSVVTYEYPAVAFEDAALRKTLAHTQWLVDATITALEDCPATPYSKQMLMRYTGSETGFRVAYPAQRPGRNEPCWCGSGVKFKRCHGSR